MLVVLSLSRHYENDFSPFNIVQIPFFKFLHQYCKKKHKTDILTANFCEELAQIALLKEITRNVPLTNPNVKSVVGSGMSAICEFFFFFFFFFAVDLCSYYLCNWSQVKLSIESHFVGVHGPYELHRKEKQMECTAYAVHSMCFNFFGSGAFNLLLFPMQFIWPWTPTKCDSILIFTSFYNKFCRGIAYFNTKNVTSLRFQTHKK